MLNERYCEICPILPLNYCVLFFIHRKKANVQTNMDIGYLIYLCIQNIHVLYTVKVISKAYFRIKKFHVQIVCNLKNRIINYVKKSVLKIIYYFQKMYFFKMVY